MNEPEITRSTFMFMNETWLSLCLTQYVLKKIIITVTVTVQIQQKAVSLFLKTFWRTFDLKGEQQKTK